MSRHAVIIKLKGVTIYILSENIEAHNLPVEMNDLSIIYSAFFHGIYG